MPWRANLPNPGPMPFTNNDAINLVTNADFTQAVFVQTHNNGQTRSAYTYVQFGGMTLCVVGHVHLTPGGGVVAGNCYIPGWENWQMITPAAQVNVIAAQADRGAFPDNNRYPH
ncbi:hypothetical protein PZ938_00390 [Luteipulveratus sp. YIM 133132]|uniref:Uncharacterized protein n=1 Tax=Luteipulveratus flavus TaxID=3031728 RepID=A0ABT6C3X0_9MICO|nr:MULTISPECIES: hypothetical protein [unclassified Luteipulveratus]MDE9364052.1 hypothetical protein [Luteipulveratus sp. YIM 133132]MDF8263555.1 hypothetical protein [Luteipulveratus sp. YIM 133296]